jgi:site-specific recombinase XerD
MRLLDAIDTYLFEVAALNDLAVNSVRSYRYRLQTFTDFLDNPNISVASALTTDNIAKYFHWLRDRNFKETTIYGKKQALRMFWDWAYENSLVHEKLKIRLKHPPEPPTIYLTPEEAQRLEQIACVGTGKYSILHLRNRAAFALLCETQIPIRAMTELTVNDYDREARTLKVGPNRILLSNKLCQVLDEYLEKRAMKRRQRMKGAIK